jgi:hypothetical protein
MPVRRGTVNEELRYALRSIQTNFKMPQTLAIGPGKPAFLNYNFIFPIGHNGGKDANQDTDMTMRWALNCDAVSDPFVWWDDDIFLMKPLDSVPLMYRSLQSKFVAMLQGDLSRTATYSRALRTQSFMIRQFGKDMTYYCYDAHVPMVVHKPLMREVLSWVRSSPGGLMKRTLYGNLCAIMTGEVGLEIVDPKVPVERKVNTDALWLSTNDYSFSNCEIGNHIRDVFGERSIWENDEQVESHRNIR